MSSKIALVVRILFALSLLVFGLNKFFHFIPVPSLDGTAGELLRIYDESGFIRIIGALEVMGGALLLMNKFVPLALTVLIAIMFNAVIFHGLHDFSGLLNALTGLSMGVLNVYFNRSRFKSLLRA